MTKVDDNQPQKERRFRLARTPEEREMQMMALAVDLSEKRLRDGTASSAEIVYWLKQASPQAMLERQNLLLQNELLQAKRDAIIQEVNDEKIFKEAMDAFKGYLPTLSDDDDIEDGVYYEK